jgi:iron complex outermembrane receptor protein
MTNYALAAALAAALATASGPVIAADAPQAATTGGGLEEIVVTSQRRTEKLMDVPMSITAFGQERLDQEGLRGVDDVARVSPGVTFLRQGNSLTGNFNDEGSDVSVRGVQSGAGASTTGIYVDDTPIQTRHLAFGSVNAFPALFDLERVEVLKGPQGTLFGAGSEGGTIRFITPEASLTKFSGYARTEFGQIDGGGQNYEAGAAFGGPIIDNVLGFRVSASFREDGGWVNRVNYTLPPSTQVLCTPCYGAFNATLYSGSPTLGATTEKNANWHDTATFRAALKWRPTETLTVDPSIYVQTLHINDTAVYWQNLSDPSRNQYNDGNALRNPSTDPWWIAAVKVGWDVGPVHLTSSTSYFSRAQHSISDYSQWLPTVYNYNQFQFPTSGQTAYATFTDSQNNFTQEFRISSADAQAPLQWTAGLYYTHALENSVEYIYSSELPVFFGLASTPQPGFVAYNQPRFSVLDKQLAAYGEASYKLTDALKLTVGLRYSKLDYTGDIQESGLFVGGLNINSTSSGTDKPLTPRVVLNYQPDPNSLYYVSAAKGFRPGGINVELPPNCTNGLPPLPATFSPDSLWHYEIGSKLSMLDRRLQLSGSLYYLQWKNIQQFVYLTCGTGFDYNLGEATGKGGDVEIAWQATSDLMLGLTAAYTDTLYTDNVSLAGVYPLVIKGDHLVGSPWNIDAHFEYVWNALGRKPYVRADYQFATAQRSLVPYQDIGNAPNDDPTLPGLPEIRVLSLRGGLRFGGFDASLIIQNALNFHSPSVVSRDLATTALNGFRTSSGSELNFDSNYFARGFAPRTYAVTVTYKW